MNDQNTINSNLSGLECLTALMLTCVISGLSGACLLLLFYVDYIYYIIIIPSYIIILIVVITLIKKDMDLAAKRYSNSLV